MEIDDKILSEIVEFCNLNGITDVKKEVHKMLQKGFNITKYGYSPFQNVVEYKEENKEEPKPKRGRPKKIDTPKIEEKIEEIKEVEKPKRKVRIIKNN